MAIIKATLTVDQSLDVLFFRSHSFLCISFLVLFLSIMHIFVSVDQLIVCYICFLRIIIRIDGFISGFKVIDPTVSNVLEQN